MQKPVSINRKVGGSNPLTPPNHHSIGLMACSSVVERPGMRLKNGDGARLKIPTDRLLTLVGQLVSIQSDAGSIPVLSNLYRGGPLVELGRPTIAPKETA